MVGMSTFRPDSVPRWAKVAAWTVPVAVLPSAVWRLADQVRGHLRGGHPCAASGEPLWEVLYVPSLSFVSLGFALLTVGLVRPWGEMLPRWMPVIGGRRVPVWFAAGAATMGALAVAALLWVAGGGPPPVPLPEGCTVPGWDVKVLYLPLHLWPPLLLAVTAHYVRRRTTTRTSPQGTHVRTDPERNGSVWTHDVRRVVAAALLRDGRVLLGHRSPHRTWYPDVWDLPGGHIEVDESPERAVARELLEEVGVTVEEADVEAVLGLDVPAGVDVHLGIYRVRRWRGRPFNACPAEHDRIGWFALDDLPHPELAHPAYLRILGGLLT
jgi:8-oxo-dGTP pyrophosphatase MutT (NUDIX family)